MTGRASLVLMLICIFAIVLAQAQVTVSGIVSDDPYPSKRASVPIEGATICLKGPGQYIWLVPDCASETTTPASGEYSFDLDGADYCMDVSASGYIAQRHCFQGLAADTTINTGLLAMGSHASVAGSIVTEMCDAGSCPPLADNGCVVQALVPDPCREDTCGDGSGWLRLAGTEISADGKFALDSIPLDRNNLEVTLLLRCGSGMLFDTIVTLRNTDALTVDFLLTDQLAVRNAATTHQNRPDLLPVLRAWDIRGRCLPRKAAMVRGSLTVRCCGRRLSLSLRGAAQD